MIPVVVMAAARIPGAAMGGAITAAVTVEAVPIPVVVTEVAEPGRVTAMEVATTGEGTVVAVPARVRAQVPARVMGTAPANLGATVTHCMSQKARPSRSSTTNLPSG